MTGRICPNSPHHGYSPTGVCEWCPAEPALPGWEAPAAASAGVVLHSGEFWLPKEIAAKYLDAWAGLTVAEPCALCGAPTIRTKDGKPDCGICVQQPEGRPYGDSPGARAIEMTARLVRARAKILPPIEIEPHIFHIHVESIDPKAISAFLDRWREMLVPGRHR